VNRVRGPSLFKRRDGWGVTGRLLLLIGVPVLGMVVLATSITLQRLETTDRATEVVRDVDRLGLLVNARSALHAERIPTEAIMRAGGVGSNTAVWSALLGYDVDQEMLDARTKVDAALAALGDDAVLDVEQLTAARAATAGSGTDPATKLQSDTVKGQYDGLDAQLSDAIAQSLVSIRYEADDLAGSALVNASLDGLSAATSALDAVDSQIGALSTQFLEGGPRKGSDITLVDATTRQQIASTALESTSLSTVTESWKDLKDDDTVQAFDYMVTDTIAKNAAAGSAATNLPDDDTAAIDPMSPTSSVPEADLEQFTDMSKAGQHYEEGLYEIITTASASMRLAVRSISDAAITDLQRWVAFAMALAVLTVIVSLWFARSISLPLRRLAVRAEAVSAGDLDQPPLGRQGQRDIAVTFEAFDDLTANLRLLDAKANALATLDFDADALAKPLPGRLGQSLQESVQVLSGSILERDQLQKSLEQQATHDALTGLHNRAAANDALERALARSRRSGVGLAVLFVDLDDFKRANDTFGHAVGDQVLREVANRMVSVARAGDFVARLGGDEFMILVENVHEADEVAHLADRMVTEVSRQIELSPLRVQIGASVGIAFAWSGDEEATQLLAWADLAVYRAKQRTSGRIEIYDTSLQQQLLDRAEIEDALIRAIPAGELFLLYQPVIDLDSGRLSGVEALVRWDRPGHGIEPPTSFIPIAETSNLIIDLDRWVLEAATRQMAAWRDTPELAHIGMAVNISGRHLLSQTLHDHMVELMDVWRDLGLEPSRLTLEITETVLVSDLETAADQLTAIRELGVGVAIDDFGTGFTSVTHLQQLPVDIIKVDRSFINRQLTERDRALLTMINDLGHHLGVSITAEGVETSDQFDVLADIGCDRAQGYFLAHPLSVADLMAFTEAALLVRTPPS
jgi:diguanylate cyclase (GGDEF)-like protein